jgi:hypothetical protein
MVPVGISYETRKMSLSLKPVNDMKLKFMLPVRLTGIRRTWGSREKESRPTSVAALELWESELGTVRIGGHG